CPASRSTYHVYNPITNYSIRIPKIIKGDDDYHYFYFRLCYDPIMENYKVVKVCASDDPTIMQIKIVTLGHGLGDRSYDDDYSSWRDIAVPTLGRCGLHSSFRHFYLNGSIYWIVETCAHRTNVNALDVYRGRDIFTEPGSVKPYILGLDTNTEIFYKIKLPDEVSTSPDDSRNLNELGGLLCLSEYFRETCELKIWTLNKKYHGVEINEWLETLKINMYYSTGNVYIELFNSIRILAILTVPKLKFIIMNTDAYRVSAYFSYDVESEQFEILHGSTTSFVHWHVNNIRNW
ncbi:hypothetical protein MKX03_017481, partial [Papaver bracteatum]